MVKVDGKYMNCTKLGEVIASKMCLGYKVTTIIEDRFGNGLFEFMKEGHTTIYVPFKEINEFDIVELEYNKLGEIRREY